MLKKAMEKKVKKYKILSGKKLMELKVLGEKCLKKKQTMKG